MNCSDFDLIENELRSKGICYIIARRIDPDDVNETLDDLISYCVQNDAGEIRFSFGNCPVDRELRTAILSRYGFRYATDIDLYIKSLPKDAESFGESIVPGIALKKLANPTIQMYADYYNAAFIDVPNARTRTLPDIDADRADPLKELGFFMLNGIPIGIYQIDYTEIPEIAAIALLEQFRQKHLGKSCLALLERRIFENGHSKCQLIAASANTGAIRLYEKTGYIREKTLSVWYSRRPR